MVKNASKFYVKLILDRVTEKTAVAEKGDETFILQVLLSLEYTQSLILPPVLSYANRSSSFLRLEVYTHHLLRKNDCIGVMEDSIDSLLSQSNSDGIQSG